MKDATTVFRELSELYELNREILKYHTVSERNELPTQDVEIPAKISAGSQSNTISIPNNNIDRHQKGKP